MKKIELSIAINVFNFPKDAGAAKADESNDQGKSVSPLKTLLQVVYHGHKNYPLNPYPSLHTSPEKPELSDNLLF